MAFIQFKDVTKTYRVGDSKVYALSNASFEIEEQGKFIIMFGPSGAGKTTFLNVLGGMDYSDSGKIIVNNEEISAYNRKKLTKYRREKIGFVFQYYNLIPNINAFDNVAISRKFGKSPFNTAEVLEAVGLGQRMKHYPNELSGGELQRVSIARALCKNPSIILCDEPTGALDSGTGKNILGLLQNMTRQYHKTVIIVTHNPAILPAADIIINIKNGNIISVDKCDNPKSISEVDL